MFPQISKDVVVISSILHRRTTDQSMQKFKQNAEERYHEIVFSYEKTFTVEEKLSTQII